ncbi:glutamyl-Q tRNA(Asp) synthetase [Allopseudospirillum japonicum]|uniref:Glutamyl-Q tRNA(Asp) synthetase n=1 Tax=Allopseudospirillum japonicum TaxID=64971 RepID=A0A1H6UEM8_9GAMM|nr:tRNA glutamyl-Q(34) synthetase GluQRS [Allopseudospirillum japonicum]SEI90853.1 glutamyl-Q tRNA(Asp) synthetase [Allopseudospirillum japonicum]
MWRSSVTYPLPLPDQGYRGRFAPTPSGPLHFGSLVTALASYLDAKAHQGLWYVRIEDLDPPREQAGAAADILRTLEAFGLYWDGEVVYQSQRQALYAECMHTLIQQQDAFACTCSRKQLAGYAIYPGWCLQQVADTSQPHAWRLRMPEQTCEVQIQDRCQGVYTWDLSQLTSVVLQRKDGPYAYQLAVTFDDAAQGMTHIVRGSDLLTSTPWQIDLQHRLGYRQPQYLHLPVVLAANGQKLSKQNHAPALIPAQAPQLLYQALHLLGQAPDPHMQSARIDEILPIAIKNWQPQAIPRVLSLYQR